MKFTKIVKNKKVIAIVLSAMMSFSSIITSKAETRKDMVNMNNKIEQRVNNKSIGIKTRAGNKRSDKKVMGKPMRVGATAYCGDTITSTGTKPKVGHTIAVDPKVIPYGTKVYIPQFNKVFIAEDCGSAIKGNRIDIFMGSYNECMEWGFKDITVYILD